MKMGWTGLESAGKSQLMAVRAYDLYKRNVRWIKKRKRMGLEFIPRTMAFDTPMSQWFIDKVESWGMSYVHFRDLSDIMPLSQVDIFINEINKFFPQRGSDPLTREQAEFLSQGAKDGVDIYFCSQDFSQAHKQFRFLVNEMYHVIKLCGSKRPIASAPPVKWIWGVVIYYPLDPGSFKGDNFSMQIKGIPRIYFINKQDTELYDTLYKVKGTKPPPIKMVEQEYIYLNEDGSEKKRVKRWAKK